MAFHFNIDNRFLQHFKNLHQVFVYIVDECNLECEQCLYKPNIKFSIGRKEIPFVELIELISDFRKMGATKLSILGGEPTLYGKKENNKPLFDLITIAKNELKYQYVRLDTNGTFDGSILYNDGFRLLDELSFSIDGYDAETNDKIRAEGVFNKAVDNIKLAIKLGYNVHITSCIYNELLEKEVNGDYKLERLIHFCEKLGVSSLNFHALIKDGTPIDTWSGNLQVTPSVWHDVYYSLQDNIRKGKYKIDLRVPQSFISKECFEKKPKYYGYCPAKLGERILVHPNGILRICSGLLGTPYGVAYYHDGQIIWNDGITNELREHKIDELTPCTNRSKKSYGDLYPLCFSFKPNQKEYVWERRIEWQKRDCSKTHT